MSRGIEITVRHPRSTARETVTRVVRNVTTAAGEEIEAIKYGGRWHRVIRRGRGIFFWVHAPVAVA